MSDSGSTTSPSAAREMQKQKRSMILTLAFFIIDLSVLLSYQWWLNPPRFRPDAPIIIMLGILSGAIIYIAGMASSGHMGPLFKPRFCPACERQIPFDAALCPYCGYRFP
jgi:predicted nucleic acid-binding Zn ribbon protein